MDKILIEQAKKAVEYKGRTALGVLTPQDTALIVVPPWQDKEILQVILDALHDKGIAADAIWEHDLMGIPYDELAHNSAAEGWKELYHQPSMDEFLISRGIVAEPEGKTCKLEELGKPLGEFLRKNPKYTAVFSSTGGDGHIKNKLAKDQMGLIKGFWEHITRERFLSKMVLFPSEIIKFVDQKVLESARKVEEIRVTDPVGTYFTYPVDEEDTGNWAEFQKLGPTSHLAGLPHMAVRQMTMRRLLKPAPIKIPKANGVIAGTCGHWGYYPHMKAYIRDGWVERVEGGGKMGELVNEIMARTRDIQYPDFPRPGWLYINGAAIGTNPKGFRNKDMFDTFERLPNSFDRLRSGVIHWDFGGETYSEESIRFSRENKLPHMHSFHIHNYYITYEVRLRGTAQWLKLIDNGHLVALEDPEVRAIAAKYGNPDELLNEDWTAPTPGINYPGDYMRDFGNDPAAWVWKEVNGWLPETIGVP